MTVHLLVNASILDSAGAYQRAVYQIHSLGRILPAVEWVFIFIPILFHALVGVLIYFTGRQNTTQYPYASNIRYTLQRVTGLIALLFILWHVFHTRGWFHFLGLEAYLGGANFRPYNAASSLGEAMRGFITRAAYAVGVLSCVFHLANGLWTMGITWGVWISAAAQRRASWICLVLGVGLAVVSMGALVGWSTVNVNAALQVEDAMFQAKSQSREVQRPEADHKRWSLEERQLLEHQATDGDRRPLDTSGHD